MYKRVKNKTGELENQLCELIIRKSMQEGSLIPSETMICEKHRVSRITARRAVGNLVAKGVLYTEHGRGSFVKSFDQARKIYGEDTLTRRIGLFMSRDNYFIQAVHGIEDVLKDAGFKIFYSSNKHYNETKEIESYINEIDGALFCPVESSPYPRKYLELFGKFKNLVIFNAPAPQENIASVSTDDIFGMQQIMRYLFSLGHRRIAFVVGETIVSTNLDRLSGYRQALAECSDACPEIIVECKEYLPDDVYFQMNKFLDSTIELPTAVVCANDYLAQGVYRSLREHKLRIPEDISVTGYGNVDISFQLNPSLTTVEQHPYAQGRLAAEMLLKQIFKLNIPEMQPKIKPAIEIKNSCAPQRIKPN